MISKLDCVLVEPPLFLFLFGGGGGGEADDVRRRLSLMVMDSDVYLGSEATNTMKMIWAEVKTNLLYANRRAAVSPHDPVLYFLSSLIDGQLDDDMTSKGAYSTVPFEHVHELQEVRPVLMSTFVTLKFKGSAWPSLHTYHPEDDRMDLLTVYQCDHPWTKPLRVAYFDRNQSKLTPTPRGLL